MALKIYRYDDASAPTLTGAAGSVNALFRACLVNGYGSKASAGWTEEFAGTGTNIAVFKMPTAPSKYLRFDDTGATNGTTKIFSYNTMTDINTGTNQTPTAAQSASGLSIYKPGDTTTARPWMLLVDGSSMFFIFTRTNSIAQGFSSVNSSVYCNFIGELKDKSPSDLNTVCMIDYSYLNYFNNNISGSSGSHYLSSKYDGSVNIEGSINITKIIPYSVYSAISGNQSGTDEQFPHPITNGITLSRSYIGQNVAPKYIRGRIPGLWFSTNIGNSTYNSGDTFIATVDGISRTFLYLKPSNGGILIIETSDTWNS